MVPIALDCSEAPKTYHDLARVMLSCTDTPLTDGFVEGPLSQPVHCAACADPKEA
jgi:hypothetical protein